MLFYVHRLKLSRHRPPRSATPSPTTEVEGNTQARRHHLEAKRIYQNVQENYLLERRLFF